MKWLHSCQRVAQLLSQRLDEPLGLRDSLTLRLHLSICGDCSNVEKQLNTIRSTTAELFNSSDDSPS